MKSCLQQNFKHYHLQAQNALNNCVLGNTTILAAVAEEQEVETIIRQLSQHQAATAQGQYHTHVVTMIITSHCRWRLQLWRQDQRRRGHLVHWLRSVRLAQLQLSVGGS